MVNIIHQTKGRRKGPEAGESEGGSSCDGEAWHRPDPDRSPVGTGGVARAPGPRAMRTRVALLDTTASLLREVPFHQLTSAHVTQRAGLSPAAFYRYFADLADAIVELTARMGDSVHAIAELVRDADWAPSARPRVRVS